ncbi:MAG: hypothetical protein Q8L57_00190, partial [bacterium]|nr:hypothetical protein [bacterium]
LFLASEAVVLAQGQKLEFKIPKMPDTVTLPQYLRGIFIFGLAAVGITAMASIMLGGIRYMASDLITTKQDAKDQILSAIQGLLLLLFSYLILNTINPELVSLRTAELKPLKKDTTTTTATTTKTSIIPPDGKFTYNSGIEAQNADASALLLNFLDCMAKNAPGDVGRISSISDSAGINTCSLNYSKPPCSHGSNSCHYGGSKCKGKSYAVDFGDEQNYQDLKSTALKCNSKAYIEKEPDHVHISIGAAYNCGCK